jgi:hypothetical protein
MNLRESRVLSAVHRLGAPTSIEVAEACLITTTEARGLLRGLEQEGTIQADGRRWTVPSAALASGHGAPQLLEGEVEVEEAGIGCAAAGIVLVLVVACLLIGIVYAIHGAFNGKF